MVRLDVSIKMCRYCSNKSDFEKEKSHESKRKKEKKDFISKHLDTSNTRLKDEEVDFLCNIIDDYMNGVRLEIFPY